MSWVDNPCGSILEAIEVYMTKECSGWIKVMNITEQKKEEEMIPIYSEKNLTISGGSGVKKMIGSISEGEGVFCGRGGSLLVLDIVMKEMEEDRLNVPLFVWEYGSLSLSHVDIMRIGMEGSSVVMNISNTSTATVTLCTIEYVWMNDGLNETTDLCSWESGAIGVSENATFTMSSSILNGTRNGGIWMDGGSISLTNSTFEGTASVDVNYASVRHNVVCRRRGDITVSMFNGQKITKNTSLWIENNGNCTFQTGEEEEVPSDLLFVPSLTTVSYTNTTHQFSITGYSLIPCSNLSFQLIYNDIAYSLPLNASNIINENSAFIEFPFSLEEEYTYYAVLTWGDNQCTEKVRIQGFEQSSNKSSVVVGVSAGIGSGLLFIIVVCVMVVIYRRYHSSHQSERDQELYHSTLIDSDDDERNPSATDTKKNDAKETLHIVSTIQQKETERKENGEEEESQDYYFSTTFTGNTTTNTSVITKHLSSDFQLLVPD